MAKPQESLPRTVPRAVGRPKAEEGRDTRADLLRVAGELFAAKGYAATSVNEVGAGAGVSVPVIYQRFGNKAGLFVAVAEDVYGRALPQMRAAVAEATTFNAAVDGVLREFATMYDVDPNLGSMVVTVLVEAARDEELNRGLQPSLRSLRELCDHIADLAPTQLAPDVAARRDLSRAIVSLFSGIMISSALLHRQPDYEGMVAATRHLLAFRPALESQQ
ncbi:TetR family transcriptional regulator [Mycobacteroides franklinii]|uniref:TetR family transcriptional regulator n=1 Tax=Mycobacteroides franklinii TaxID=948102 RepID=UPI0013E8A62C